jgi:hypothetical protein
MLPLVEYEEQKVHPYKPASCGKFAKMMIWSSRIFMPADPELQ